MSSMWNKYDDLIYNTYNYGSFHWDEIFKDSEEFKHKMKEVGGDKDNLDELYEILSIKYFSATTRYNVEEAFLAAIRRELFIAWPMYLEQKRIVKDMIDMDMEKLRTEMETIRETERLDNTGSEATTTGSTIGSDSKTDTVEQDTSDKDLTNVVNANTSPIVNADTIAIKDKSNIQTSGNKTGTMSITTDSSGTNDVSVNTNLQDNSTYESEGLERYKQLSNDLVVLTDKYEAIRRDYLAQIYRKMDPLFRVII